MESSKGIGRNGEDGDPNYALETLDEASLAVARGPAAQGEPAERGSRRGVGATAPFSSAGSMCLSLGWGRRGGGREAVR